MPLRTLLAVGVLIVALLLWLTTKHLRARDRGRYKLAVSLLPILPGGAALIADRVNADEALIDILIALAFVFACLAITDFVMTIWDDWRRHTEVRKTR